MSVISNLTVKLAADTAAFDKKMKNAAAESRAFNRDVKAAFTSTRTPAEQFSSAMDRLNHLHTKGGIDATTHARAVAKLEAEFKDAGKAATQLAGHASSARDSLMSLGRQALTGLGISVGVHEVIGFLKSSVEEYRRAEQEQRKLAAVLDATGHAAGFTKEQLNEYASALQRTTNYDDDAVAGAQAVLATFRQIQGVQFTQATKAILDLSSVMDQDLKSSAVQIGKALNDPIRGLTALRRVGVSFTNDQEAMIKAMVKAGDVMGAQTVILDELQSEFGGAAERMRDEITGLSNDFGDLKEAIGSIVDTDAAKAMERSIGAGIRNVTTDVQKLSAALNASSTSVQRWQGLFASQKLAGLFNAASGNYTGFLQSIQADMAQQNITIPQPTIPQTTQPPERDTAAVKALAEQAKQYDDATKAIEREVAALQLEIQTIGQTADQKKLAALAAKGATDADLEELRALQQIASQAQTEFEAQRKATESQAAAKKAAEDYIAALNQQADTFGMTAREAQIYAMQIKGATDEQIAQMQALDATISKIERENAAMDRDEQTKEAMIEEGKRMHESLKTVSERYTDEIARLKELHDAHAINDEDFDRARQRALENLNQSTGKPDRAAHSTENRAILAGTAEAFAAIHRANDDNLRNARFAKPQDAKPGAKQDDKQRENREKQMLDIERRMEIIQRDGFASFKNLKVWA